MKRIFLYLLLLFLCSIIVFAQKITKVDYTKKIVEATPKSLLQSPVVKRLTSDAQDDGLKGKVKSLVEEREGLTGIEKPIGKRLSLIADFDEWGNYLKQVNFEYRGRPYNVTVYGYIDNQRVSLSNSINFGDELFVAMLGDKPKADNKNKPDTRYNSKYEYKYVNSKLSELQFFDNKGAKSGRIIYKYGINQIEKLNYTEGDELNSKYLYIFDDKGNESGRVDFNVRQPQIPESNKFQYQNIIFDEKGNWTKRTFSRLEIENGKEVYKPIAIEFRTITYYP
jgi:hypothetical protein